MLRIDPPYLVCAVLVLALNYASSLAPGYRGAPFHFDLKQLLLHLGYLNALAGSKWLNNVFWTLAIEFQFYLLIALLFPLVVAARARVRVLTCAALGALAFLFPHRGLLVFEYLCLFLLGIWAFQIRAGLVPDKRWQACGWVVWTAGVGATLGVESAVAGLLAGWLISHIQLSWGWALFLGQISYSLYLVHVPIGMRVVSLGDRFTSSYPAKVGVLVFAAAVTMVVAYGFYRWVEMPAQRLASAIRYRPSGAAKNPVAPC